MRKTPVAKIVSRLLEAVDRIIAAAKDAEKARNDLVRLGNKPAVRLAEETAEGNVPVVEKDTLLSSVGLSARAINVIARASGIRYLHSPPSSRKPAFPLHAGPTVGHLLAISRDELYATHACGRGTLQEILDWLHVRGLKLRDD